MCGLFWSDVRAFVRLFCVMFVVAVVVVCVCVSACICTDVYSWLSVRAKMFFWSERGAYRRLKWMCNYYCYLGFLEWENMRGCGGEGGGRRCYEMVENMWRYITQQGF